MDRGGVPQDIGLSQPHSSVTVTVGYPPAQINDYLTQAILATIFCFWPVGIFAIIKSSQCRSALGRGDTSAAQKHSGIARKLCIAALIIGIICVVIMITMIGVYFGVIATAYSAVTRFG